MTSCPPNAPLAARLCAAPVVYDASRAERELAELAVEAALQPELSGLGAALAEPPVRALLAGVFGASPYLTALIRRRTKRLADILATAPEAQFDTLRRRLDAATDAAPGAPAAMTALRDFKSDIAH